MSPKENVEHIIQNFIVAEPENCHSIKNNLILAVNTPTAATEATFLLISYIINARHEMGNNGFYKTVHNPERMVMILEVLHECLTAGADFEPVISPISRLLHLERKEREKSQTELYLQYRVAALLDEALRMGVAFPKEAINRILSPHYFSDKQTKEYICSIYRSLAEQGVDISCKINDLITILHNKETLTLENNALSALWAAVRKGFFDSHIPDSDKTCHVWLWHLVTTCTWKLKTKYEEITRLGSVGCLIETARRYPQTQSLILECMEKWGIREPKRPRTDFHHDLVVLFSLCKENPGTTCLPTNYTITKKGVMMT